MIIELVEFGTEQILLIVVVSFAGIIDFTSPVFGFIGLCSWIHVYEPMYILGPVGFEPTTASAPGLYLAYYKMVS